MGISKLILSIQEICSYQFFFKFLKPFFQKFPFLFTGSIRTLLLLSVYTSSVLLKVTFFRLCGMQVYNVTTGKYLCHNKYYGRSLSPGSFKTTIAEFLSNDSSEQVQSDQTIKIVFVIKFFQR